MARGYNFPDELIIPFLSSPSPHSFFPANFKLKLQMAIIIIIIIKSHYHGCKRPLYACPPANKFRKCKEEMAKIFF